MDQLPCELFYNIVRYLNDPFDLYRISYVCNRWRLFIMNDEYFLNEWFSRSLKYSRQACNCTYFDYNDDDEQQLMFINIRSLFPITFRSSPCYLLPRTVPIFSSDDQYLFGHSYSSSHSFSFWLFLPQQCSLNMEIISSTIHNQTISLYDNINTDQWIHMVLNKKQSQINYKIWINGQYISNKKAEQHNLLFKILLCHKIDNRFQAPSTIRVADLNALKRCLIQPEIQAIYQQQIPIDQVKVGTYINSNKIHLSL